MPSFPPDSMTENIPSQNSTTKDPFSDHPHIHFDASPRTEFTQGPGVPMRHPFESELGVQEYDDNEYMEKQPLNADQNFAGGFYPPP